MGNRRAPIVAGVAVAAVLLLAIVFLVLPKMGQVGDAQDELDQAMSEEATLRSQLAALQQAQVDAPAARETIRRVQQAIPPTADQQGMILLLQNAADQSGVDLFTVTPNTPVFDDATGLSTITTAITVNGSYFAIDQFLFRIETLPRAAKVTSVTLAPGGTDTGVSQLTMQASVDLYTSDTSAGPGSIPGPTEADGTTVAPATTPPAAERG